MRWHRRPAPTCLPSSPTAPCCLPTPQEYERRVEKAERAAKQYKEMFLAEVTAREEAQRELETLQVGAASALGLGEGRGTADRLPRSGCPLQPLLPTPAPLQARTEEAEAQRVEAERKAAALEVRESGRQAGRGTVQGKGAWLCR